MSQKVLQPIQTDELQSAISFQRVCAFTVVWFFLSFAGLVYGMWDRVETGYLGLTTARFTQQGWEILEVQPGSPAQKAGVRPGWLLVSLQGRKLGPKALLDLPETLVSRGNAIRWRALQEWLREELDPGNEVVLEFSTAGAGSQNKKKHDSTESGSDTGTETGFAVSGLSHRRKDKVIVRVRSEKTSVWLVFKRSILYILVGMAFLFMGLFLVNRKPRSRPALRLLAFCLFHQAFLFTQPLTEFPRGLAIPQAASIAFVEASDVLFMLSAAAMLHFVLSFVGLPGGFTNRASTAGDDPAEALGTRNGRPARSSVFSFVYKGCVIPAGVYVAALIVWGLHTFKIGAPYTLSFGPVIYSISFGLLIREHWRSRESPGWRKQLKWLLWGGGVPVAALLLIWYMNFLTDTQIRRSDTSLLLAMSTLAFPGATVLAVLRHRLFDIDIIVRRSMLAVVVLPLAALGYLGIMRAVGAAFDFSEPPLVMIMILIFLVLFLPGQIGFEERLDRLLGRRRYNIRMSLQDLAGEMVDEEKIESLVERTVEKIREVMELKYCTVFISDLDMNELEPYSAGEYGSPPERLDFSVLDSLEANCAPLFVDEFSRWNLPTGLGRPTPVVMLPLAVGSRKWGLLALGSHKVKVDWHRGDFEALTLVAGTLAMAVDRIYHKQLLRKVQAMQAQVIHAGRLAALGTLAAGVAHELNTPLGYVKSNAQVLAGRLPSIIESGDQGDLLELVQDISEGADQMRAVVSNLRSFSQVDSSGDRRLDLNASIRQSLAMMEKSRPPGVEMQVELGEIPMVKGFSAQLNQMVVNLVKNAWDAVKGQGKVLLVTDKSEGGEHVFFRVIDNGEGISKEIADRIFDPFFTTKNVGKGMGLGLSITRTIVESHGGTLSVGSRKDGLPGAEAVVILAACVE